MTIHSPLAVYFFTNWHSSSYSPLILLLLCWVTLHCTHWDLEEMPLVLPDRHLHPFALN